MTALGDEANGLNLGNTLVIAAVDNCAQNDDGADIFDWPPELANANIVGVGAINTFGAVAMTNFSATGPATVDIAAPGTGFTILDNGGGLSTGCTGTSFAAPLVTGTLGLMIVNDGALAGNGAGLLARLICNSTANAGIAGSVGGGGLTLNIGNAVTNANACP